MAEIIQLDDLIPGDVEIHYRDEIFTIPGDLDTETVLKVFKTFRGMLDLVSQEDATEQQVKKAASDMNALLLQVFQINRPELTTLPFGTKSTPMVVKELLKSLGMNVDGDELPPTIPAPANRSQRRKQPSSRTAPRAKK